MFRYLLHLSNNFLTWSVQTGWILSNRNLLVSVLEAQDHSAGDRLTKDFSPGWLPTGPHVQKGWAGSLGVTQAGTRLSHKVTLGPSPLGPPFSSHDVEVRTSTYEFGKTDIQTTAPRTDEAQPGG